MLALRGLGVGTLNRQESGQGVGAGGGGRNRAERVYGLMVVGRRHVVGDDVRT